MENLRYRCNPFENRYLRYHTAVGTSRADVPYSRVPMVPAVPPSRSGAKSILELSRDHCACAFFTTGILGFDICIATSWDGVLPVEPAAARQQVLGISWGDRWAVARLRSVTTPYARLKASETLNTSGNLPSERILSTDCICYFSLGLHRIGRPHILCGSLHMRDATDRTSTSSAHAQIAEPAPICSVPIITSAWVPQPDDLRTQGTRAHAH